ncbi:hypothetical protein D3C86_1601100 [compost metagenome]
MGGTDLGSACHAIARIKIYRLRDGSRIQQVSHLALRLKWEWVCYPDQQAFHLPGAWGSGKHLVRLPTSITFFWLRKPSNRFRRIAENCLRHSCDMHKFKDPVALICRQSLVSSGPHFQGFIRNDLITFKRYEKAMAVAVERQDGVWLEAMRD